MVTIPVTISRKLLLIGLSFQEAHLGAVCSTRRCSFTLALWDQTVLPRYLPRYRDSVKDLLGKKMNALARKFHETHDINVKNELERLLKEYGKLKQPWVFVSKTQKEI
jgi:hypothetical protein